MSKGPCGGGRAAREIGWEDDMADAATLDRDVGAEAGEGALLRAIGWKDAFWVASGVPALVLFSIGGIAIIVGAPSALVWTISIIFGLIQAFTYAEIAGLFPGKSGGASIYGATAWLPYSKVIAPLSVWCNWLAWSPVLVLGASLGAGYIINALFAESSGVRTWNTNVAHLDFVQSGLTVHLNSTVVLGAVLLLAVFAVQHRGISGTARIQLILGGSVVGLLFVIGVVPLLNGSVSMDNFSPFKPLAGFTDAGAAINGAWDKSGWLVFLGGLFIAAWSTYAFETAICYTSEFKDPKRDTPRAIFSAGILCLILFVLVPFTFQGALGVDGLGAAGVADGSNVAEAMGSMLNAGSVITNIIVFLLVIALIVTIMTSMAGSSRTLYQGSVDGWLPRYLSKVNSHGAPTRAMWTDLVFNMLLLTLSSSLLILAISNCCYLVFNFLNLHSGWIHRVDNGDVPRPWRAPTILIAAGAVLAFVNAGFLGAGSDVWGADTLRNAVIAMALVIPVFLFRHYVTDKGVFPEHMLDDLSIEGGSLGVKRAGALPYVVLAAGAVVVFAAHWYFFQM